MYQNTNQYPTRDEVLISTTPVASETKIPNTLLLSIEATADYYNKIEPFSVRYYDSKEEMLTAMAEEMKLSLGQGNFTLDPIRGELTVSLTFLGRMGFFSDIGGEVVHQVLRSSLELDGWEDVQFRPATDGIVTLRLRSNRLMHANHNYQPTATPGA